MLQAPRSKARWLLVIKAPAQIKKERKSGCTRAGRPQTALKESKPRKAPTNLLLKQQNQNENIWNDSQVEREDPCMNRRLTVTMHTWRTNTTGLKRIISSCEVSSHLTVTGNHTWDRRRREAAENHSRLHLNCRVGRLRSSWWGKKTTSWKKQPHASHYRLVTSCFVKVAQWLIVKGAPISSHNHSFATQTDHSRYIYTQPPPRIITE